MSANGTFVQSIVAWLVGTQRQVLARRGRFICQFETKGLKNTWGQVLHFAHVNSKT